jgi:hypothetical protein
MDLSQLDLGALTRALDDPDPDREHFMELATGRLWTFVLSQATDETRRRYDEIQGGHAGEWVRLPAPTPREAYEEAEDFVESIAAAEIRESLFDALERRGSLKDFREQLMQHADERAGWLALRRRRSRWRLEAFLRSIGADRVEVPEAPA